MKASTWFFGLLAFAIKMKGWMYGELSRFSLGWATRSLLYSVFS